MHPPKVGNKEQLSALTTSIQYCTIKAVSNTKRYDILGPLTHISTWRNSGNIMLTHT